MNLGRLLTTKNLMQIGPYSLPNNLILAPMAGVSDKPFRQLCRRFGAGLAVSEMINAKASTWGTPKSVRRLDHTDEEGPISVQVLGADPQEMADAAKINVDHGAQIIDINMGCPARKVCNVAAGSALLRDERKVAAILEQVVNAVAVPVTLKIRTGWDRQQRNAVSIGRIAEQCGIQALAIHGRTRACGFSGEAEYVTIAEVKQSIDIPVIANGDIINAEKAQQVLEFTRADGLMLGRAAQGNPWIFQQIDHYLRYGQHLPSPTAMQVKQVLLQHLHALYDFYGEQRGVAIARKHIGWYSKYLPGSHQFRSQINHAQNIPSQLDLVTEYFDSTLIAEHRAA